ncbi:MAG: hypothetical protein JO270_00145 [Acidobacteriaceae bacterium]|nr:hypothetical protein [Acidobacteriaceae bacterium]
MFNLICLGVFAWGVFEIFSGIRILLYVPFLLLAKFTAKPMQIGYPPEVLKKMYEKKPEVDENGIPWL